MAQSLMLISPQSRSRYLPQIRLPDNIHANPDLISSATNASVLIFVVPHQFVRGVCAQLKAGKQANGGSTLREDVKAISLIKVRFAPIAIN